jgi:hypothetical protein
MQGIGKDGHTVHIKATENLQDGKAKVQEKGNFKILS